MGTYIDRTVRAILRDAEGVTVETLEGPLSDVSNQVRTYMLSGAGDRESDGFSGSVEFEVVKNTRMLGEAGAVQSRGPRDERYEWTIFPVRDAGTDTEHTADEIDGGLNSTGQRIGERIEKALDDLRADGEPRDLDVTIRLYEED